MGAEPDFADDEAASVFSARKIAARLNAPGPNPVSAFRDTLAWGRERLYGLFNEGQAAESLVHARARLVDEVLKEVWRRTLPANTPGLTLVAVGGYGRTELLPHSDIDILFLHEDGALDGYRDALESLTAFLWDIGLEVGSSVRSVEHCVEEATKDITVITNLLEARVLIGDLPLFARMQQALTPDRVWSVADFFNAKLAEQAARYRKYDDTGYKLEPNVKESPGGLRDIHTIGWVAKRFFGAQTMYELRERGFLTKQECDELFAGQDFLWRVRFALHMVSRRREDRLLFDHQIKVAELFGYVDTDRNRAVEQFMQLYYRTIKSLSCLNDMLLQLFREAILGAGQEAPVRVLNSRFQLRGSAIETRADDVFQKSPQAMLELFLLMQQHPEIDSVAAPTVRQLLRDNRLIDDAVRSDVRTRQLFMQIFRHANGLTRALRRMNRYGVLGRYLPSFGKVVGLMQYDLFHTLTVDEHLLYVVRNLRRMSMPRLRHELPFCSDLFERVDKPELLYLAAFFHDQAKGRGADHSELGAREAEAFCLAHGLSHADADMVGWLVRHHLTMSLTAQRADIHDPQILADFAEKVGDRRRLDALLLLTVADIRATNPALWNSWRESLLRDLYRSTVRTLERGPENPLHQDEMVAEAKAGAIRRLLARNQPIEASETVWPRFDRDYFLRHSPEELAWHLPAISAASDATLPLVLVEAINGRGTTVFVYMRDRDQLFALATGVLARLGLNILDARINTTDDGYVLDSFVVVEGDGSAIHQPLRFAEIRDALRRVLADASVTVIDVNRRISQRLRHFDTPTTVRFSQDRARGRTVLELVAADQPGLLSLIGRVFSRHQVVLNAAKIATIGERAEDVFFITDRQHQMITDEARLDALRDLLVRTLSRTDVPSK